MKNEVAVIAAVSKGLDYRKQHPSCLSEDVLQHINSTVREERDQTTKLAMIVATSLALDFLDKHPAANEKLALQHVMASLTEILQTAGGL